MSKAGRGGRRESAKRVLIFGENENDTRAIKELISALCPSVGPVEVRRKPLVLIKNASPDSIRHHAERLAAAVTFDDKRKPVACVFAHEDCDALEPAHEAVATRIEEALGGALRRAGAGDCSVHAVVPAWEMENWWLLWPDQVAGLVAGWRTPDYAGRDVGKVANGKEALAKALRPTGRRGGRGRGPREYRESDSPEMARAVRQAGLAERPGGSSAAYDRFRQSVRECCARSGGAKA